MPLARHTLGTLAGSLLLALAAVGCSAASTSNTGASPTTSDTKVTEQNIKIASAVVGGKPGKVSTANPVTIGFINDNGVNGVDGKPFQNAVNAAVAFLNHDLGGVQGRQVQIKTCELTQSQEQGTTCAQQMINDPSVSAIVTGAVNFGESQILATVAGAKPLFSTIPGSTAVGSAKNVFAFNGGVLAAESILTYTANQHPKTVAMIGVQDAVTGQIVGMWKSTLEKLGVPTVTSALFDVSSTDLTSTIVASGAAKADMVVLVTPIAQACVAAAKGFQKMNITTPTVALGTCADPAIGSALGGLPKWTYYTPYRNPLASDDTGQSSAYNQAAKTYGDANLAQANFAPGVFGTVLDMAAVLNKSGDLKPADIENAAEAWTGPSFLGEPTESFGHAPFPAIASLDGLFYTYDGKNWNTAADGKWISPPRA